MTTDESYIILEIKPGSSKEEITKAFRKKAMKFHPDKGGDPNVFKKIVDAKEYLLKPPPPPKPTFNGKTADEILKEYLRTEQASLQKELDRMVRDQQIVVSRVGVGIIYFTLASIIHLSAASFAWLTVPCAIAYLAVPKTVFAISERIKSKRKKRS